MPESMNDLPRPYSLDCPDYDALWRALEATVLRLAHLRARTAIAAMHDLTLIADLPDTTEIFNSLAA